jgi:hypothetical protein
MYHWPVNVRRGLRHAGILFYLLVTFAAFLFTMTRVRVPVLPWPLVAFSYGMMAPYQGYHPWNGDLRAEGLAASGGWERVDLSPYFPFGRGEANIRTFFLTFRARGESELRDQERKFARQVWVRESESGRTYRHLRMWREQWPASPLGFDALRREPFVTTELLSQVP